MLADGPDQRINAAAGHVMGGFGVNGAADHVKLKVIHLLSCSVKKVTFVSPKQMYKL